MALGEKISKLQMETKDPYIDTDILELQPTNKTAIRGKPVALYILSQTLGGGGEYDASFTDKETLARCSPQGHTESKWQSLDSTPARFRSSHLLSTDQLHFKNNGDKLNKYNPMELNVNREKYS